MPAWTLRPLVSGDVEHLARLACTPREAALGEHGETEPIGYFAGLIGDGSPDIGGAVGAFDPSGELIAAAALRRRTRPRLHHAMRLFPFGGADDGRARDALGAIVDRLLDIADRWANAVRCDVRTAADDPRVDAVLVPRGFAVEVRAAGALARGGAWVDDVTLGRVRPGWRAPPPMPTAAWELPPRPSTAESVRSASVRVRETTVGDAEAMHALMTEPSVVWGTLQTPLQSPEHWRRLLAGNAERRSIVLCVEVDGAFAGNIGMHAFGPSGRAHAMALGMSVRPEHQGKGLGGMLVDEALSRAFEMGVVRVELEVYEDNVPAVRLYESRGFVREGVRRAAAFRDGTFVDNVTMARVAGAGAAGA